MVYFLVAVAAAIAWLLWPSKSKPLYYRAQKRAELPRFVEGLFSQGGRGQQLIVAHEGSERFLQFEKASTGPERQVFYAFPDAQWSRPFYAQVSARLSGGGFRCTEQATGDEHVPRYWVVNGLDSPERVLALFDVVADTLGIPADATFTVHYEGPLSLNEWLQWRRAKKAALAAT